MSSQFSPPPYNNALTYRQFDVIYSIYDGVSTNHASPYFYATQDVGPGSYSPSGFYRFPLTAWALSEDIVTLTYNHTGGPKMVPGSQIRVTGITANTAINYTGMVMIGGSGTLQYISPGWTQSSSTSVGAIECLSPAWSTGFFFQPTYSSKVGTENQTNVAKLGDGYSQRSPKGINTFDQTINLVYQNRTQREAKAITNYVQDKAGATPFEILIPDQFLNDDPNQKWIAAGCDVTPVSFQRFDITVTVSRVFDP